MNVLALQFTSEVVQRIDTKGFNSIETPSHAEGLSAIKAAAKHGDKHAQFELARRYESGQGVKLNLKTALHWYSRASKTDISQKYVYLGPLASNGHGRAIPIGTAQTKVGIPGAALRAAAIRKSLKGWNGD